VTASQSQRNLLLGVGAAISLVLVLVILGSAGKKEPPPEDETNETATTTPTKKPDKKPVPVQVAAATPGDNKPDTSHPTLATPAGEALARARYELKAGNYAKVLELCDAAEAAGASKDDTATLRKACSTLTGTGAPAPQPGDKPQEKPADTGPPSAPPADVPPPSAPQDPPAKPDSTPAAQDPPAKKDAAPANPNQKKLEAALKDAANSWYDARINLVCSDCGGKGSTKCTACNGTGDSVHEETIGGGKRNCKQCSGTGQIPCHNKKSCLEGLSRYSLEKGEAKWGVMKPALKARKPGTPVVTVDASDPTKATVNWFVKHLVDTEELYVAEVSTWQLQKNVWKCTECQSSAPPGK
jgi:hypothetical protein